MHCTKGLWLHTVHTTWYCTYQAVWAANIVVDDHYPTTVITNVGCFVRVCSSQSPLKPNVRLCYLTLTARLWGSCTRLYIYKCISTKRIYQPWLLSILSSLSCGHQSRVATIASLRKRAHTIPTCTCVYGIQARMHYVLRTSHWTLPTAASIQGRLLVYCVHYLWLQFEGGYYSSTWSTVQSQNSWLEPCTSLKGFFTSECKAPTLLLVSKLLFPKIISQCLLVSECTHNRCTQACNVQ